MPLRGLLTLAALLGSFALSCASEAPVMKEPATGGSKPADKEPDKDKDKEGVKGAPSSSPGSGSGADVACKGPPKVGNPVSHLKVTSVNGGQKVEIAPGKVTIVDLWATWCGPCKQSFPKYQDLYTKYKASGLEIIAVSLDDPDTKGEIVGFAKANGNVKFPVAWDDKKAVAKCFSPDNMPTAYVIDKKGVLRHIHRGYHDGEEREIEKEIKALL